MFDSLNLSCIEKLSKVLDVVTSSNLNLESKGDVLDFHSNKAVLAKKELEKSYEELLRLESELKSYRIDNILDSFEKLKDSYSKKNYSDMKTHLFNIGILLPSGKAVSETKISVEIPKVPIEIKNELELDIKETENCYNAGCFRSAVILCGRILETALHRKYYEKTGNDILETNPSIGLGKLIAKLHDFSVIFPPGITEQIHLINKVRISSVHKKKVPFIPSKHQTNAIMLYTFDILDKLF